MRLGYCGAAVADCVYQAVSACLLLYSLVVSCLHLLPLSCCCYPPTAPPRAMEDAGGWGLEAAALLAEQTALLRRARAMLEGMAEELQAAGIAVAIPTANDGQPGLPPMHPSAVPTSTAPGVQGLMPSPQRPAVPAPSNASRRPSATHHKPAGTAGGSPSVTAPATPSVTTSTDPGLLTGTPPRPARPAVSGVGHGGAATATDGVGAVHRMAHSHQVGDALLRPDDTGAPGGHSYTPAAYVRAHGSARAGSSMSRTATTPSPTTQLLAGAAARVTPPAGMRALPHSAPPPPPPLHPAGHVVPPPAAGGAHRITRPAATGAAPLLRSRLFPAVARRATSDDSEAAAAGSSGGSGGGGGGGGGGADSDSAAPASGGETDRTATHDAAADVSSASERETAVASSGGSSGRAPSGVLSTTTARRVLPVARTGSGGSGGGRAAVDAPVRARLGLQTHARVSSTGTTITRTRAPSTGSVASTGGDGTGEEVPAADASADGTTAAAIEPASVPPPPPPATAAAAVPRPLARLPATRSIKPAAAASARTATPLSATVTAGGVSSSTAAATAAPSAAMSATVPAGGASRAPRALGAARRVAPAGGGAGAR